MDKKPFEILIEILIEEERILKEKIEKAEKEKEKEISVTRKEIEEQRKMFLEQIENRKKEWLNEGILEIEKKCNRLIEENNEFLTKMDKIYLDKKKEIVFKILKFILPGYGN